MSFAYMIVYFVAAAACALIALNIGRQRAMKGGSTLTALMVNLSLWALFAGFSEAAFSIESKIILVKVQFFFIALTPVCLLVLALKISAYGHFVSKRFLTLLAIVPILTLVAVWSNPFHQMFWTDVRWEFVAGERVAVYLHGSLYWAWTVVAYALLAVAIAILIRAMWGVQQLFHNQVVVVLLAISALLGPQPLTYF